MFQAKQNLSLANLRYNCEGFFKQSSFTHTLKKCNKSNFTKKKILSFLFQKL